MKLQIFAVRDRATDCYGNPMFLISVGQAVRSFGDEVNRSADDNLLFSHSDDYDLYHFGEFDTSSGLFVLIPPEQVAIGKNLRLNGLPPSK